jgi:DNA-binding transcriptional LysR family regulator
VQSSRRLEREASRNVELMWLTGRLAPDHKTIANFRKDSGRAIRQVCAQFVTLCRQMGLLNTASVAIDGSKFKAVNNRDRNFTRAKLGNTIVPRAIRVFQAKHPDIALTLQVHPTTRVRELVGSGEFDIGLAADEVDLSGVEHRTFGSFRAVCAIPSGHPLSARPTITPEDLEGVPLVALAPEDRARQRFDAVLEAAGVRSKIVVETPSSSTVCALALEGVGVGLVNPAATDGFPERGLVFRPFEPAVYFKSILLFRPDAQQARLVREFVAALLQARDTRHSLAESPAQ